MDNKGRVNLKGIYRNFGNFVALDHIDLDIQPCEFFALLGPSGSGKTTTLRMIAGLDTPNKGVIEVDAIDVTHAPPAERDIAMVFQNYALYPHMTVRGNIAFPLKMDKVPKSAIEEMVAEAARKVDIEHLLDRRPGQLSGGQQQRCALARAIVRQPVLFLLDEPLSNLDAKLRLQTRVELKKLQRSLNVTTIYVTHDQEEAMTLADRMAVFQDGKILQIGTPEEVFNRPQTIEVAGFIGSPPMNLLEAEVNGNQISIAGESMMVERSLPVTSGRIKLGVRPSHIRVDPTGIPARLYLSENLGESFLLNAYLGDNLLKIRVSEMPAVEDGEVIKLAFDTDYLHFYNAETGVRIE